MKRKKKPAKQYTQQSLIPETWLDQMAAEERQKRIDLYANDYKLFPLILHKSKEGADVGIPNVLETEWERFERICRYVDGIFKPSTIKK